MTKRNLLVELRHTERLERSAAAAMVERREELDAKVVPELDLMEFDESFAPVAIPALQTRAMTEDPYDVSPLSAIDRSAENETYFVRGTVEEGELDAFEKEAKKNRSVVNVFSDVAIDTQLVCPGSPPVGSDATVERLLCVEKMHGRGMDGSGVMVAIVDTGVNIAYLNNRGKTPNFDAQRSWAWHASLTPGSMTVGHGTMCAYDVCIAAPRCTILDIALLRPMSGHPLMGGLLSDAIRAYRHLLDVMNDGPRRPGESRSLVVNNSWGMFHPSWDYPVGHPGNYSDNPNHPFNRIVATLERAGADILFAAGNCGADCPDERCDGVTSNAIYGANSHAQVTCVAGVDTTKQRVGYSTVGPGRLTRQKPDVCGYTHFSGSGVYAADGGTSAATPVVAGVVAAMRTKRPYNAADSQTHPSAIRNLLTSTAEDLGTSGYDFRHGWGVVNGCALADKVAPPEEPSVPPPSPGVPPELAQFCRRYPWICRLLFGTAGGAASGLSSEPSRLAAMFEASPAAGRELSDAELAFLLGYLSRGNSSDGGRCGHC